MRSSGRTLELFADTRDLPFDEKDLSYSEELWQKAAEAVKDEGDAVRRHVRQGLFWTDYTLFFSEPGRYYVSRDMQRRVRNRTAVRARRILTALNDFDFKMGHDTIARQELEMAARLVPEKMKMSDATVVRLAEIYVHWTLGKLVADKTADGGWSLQVDKKNFRRSALVHGRDFVYDANVRYKVRLRTRIVRKADAPDGEAFRFGVGKKDAKGVQLCERVFRASELSSEWRWHDVGEMTFDDACEFWIGTCKPAGSAQSANSTFDAVYVDALQVERAEGGGRGEDGK